MLETGTGPVFLGQILIINVVNIEKKFNNFTKAALTSKNGGKIRKNEKKSIFFFTVKKNQSIILYSVTENYFSSLSTILTSVSKKIYNEENAHYYSENTGKI